MAMWAWSLDVSLPERIEFRDEDMPRIFCGLSPTCTKMVAVYSSIWRDFWLNDAKHGAILADSPLEDDDSGSGEVYDLIFDSEYRFYLKIDGPEQHVKIPYEITPISPSRQGRYKITKGEPMSLPEPRRAPYTLNASCEWVLDAQSRKIRSQFLNHYVSPSRSLPPCSARLIGLDLRQFSWMPSGSEHDRTHTRQPVLLNDQHPGQEERTRTAYSNILGVAKNERD